jgi:hypothetical protein
MDRQRIQRKVGDQWGQIILSTENLRKKPIQGPAIPLLGPSWLLLHCQRRGLMRSNSTVRAMLRHIKTVLPPSVIGIGLWEPKDFGTGDQEELSLVHFLIAKLRMNKFKRIEFFG